MNRLDMMDEDSDMDDEGDEEDDEMVCTAISPS